MYVFYSFKALGTTLTWVWDNAQLKVSTASRSVVPLEACLPGTLSVSER